MYFSRVRISLRHLDEFAKQFQYNYYQQHQLLWKLFRNESEKKRDFLFRQDTDNQGLPVYYILSETKPSQSINYLHVESKPFSPQLKTGDLLAFSLRANPVEQITKERSIEEQEQLRKQRQEKGLKNKETLPHKRIRHDVVMHLKNSLTEEEKKNYTYAKLEQQAGECWLKQQAKNKGFEVLSVIAEGYQQHQFKKRNIKISTLDFQGILEVTNPELFFSEVFYGVVKNETEPRIRGIGSAKAFGCGLMLIKRA